jgi:hypothetical protein
MLGGKIKLPKKSQSSLPPISLTSFPPRFESLPLVLMNLLDQDMVPSQIHVWIAADDFEFLDTRIVELMQSSIVQFHQTEDYGPHKKWLPMAQTSESRFIICDDDVFYPKNWYRRLVESDSEEACVGHRCHRLRFSSQGLVLPYSDWQKDVRYSGNSSHTLTAIGCGGVMIHPRRIAKHLREWELIREVCPMSDDTWLKVAHIESNTPYVKSGYTFPYIDYAGSQDVSLMSTNVDRGGKDKMLALSLEKLELDLSLLTREASKGN